MSKPDPHQKSGLQEQSFLSHIVELRDRVTAMVLGVLVPFIVFAVFANELTTFVAQPVLANLQVPGGEASGGTVQTIKPLGAFLTPLKVALITAIITALPWILYQGWRFVAPALYRHEKRFVLPLLISSAALYYVGIAFAFYVVLPLVFGFLVQVGPDWLNVAPDISEYVDFVLTVFLAFAVAFQVPIATILLIGTGVVDIATLRQKRPYVIVGAFVLGMLLTPPDIISQTLLAVPVWLLFEIGIFFSAWFFPKAGTPGTGEEAESDRQTSDGDSPLTEAEMEREMDAMEAWEDEEEGRKENADSKTKPTGKDGEPPTEKRKAAWEHDDWLEP